MQTQSLSGSCLCRHPLKQNRLSWVHTSPRRCLVQHGIAPVCSLGDLVHSCLHVGLPMQNVGKSRVSPAAESHIAAASSGSPASGQVWVPEADLQMPEVRAAAGAPAAVGYGGNGRRPRTPPPDLPSLLLDARICYLGMPVRACSNGVQQRGQCHCASWLALLAQATPPTMQCCTRLGSTGSHTFWELHHATAFLGLQTTGMQSSSTMLTLDS